MDTSEPASVTQWCDKAREGDSLAQQNLWNRYRERLIRLASKRLESHRRVRHADAEDVVTEVFSKFLMQIQKGEYPEVDRDDIWRLLVDYTTNKVIDQVKWEYREKRGGVRDEGKIVGHQVVGESILMGPDGQRKGVDGEPAPTLEFVDSFIESCSCLQEMDLELRKIAILKAEGKTHEEIAQISDCKVKQVDYRVKKIKEVLFASHLKTRIPEDLVQIETWRSMENLGVKEIADRLGILESSVKRKLDLIDRRLGRT